MSNKVEHDLLELMALPASEFNKRLGKPELDAKGKIVARMDDNKYTATRNPPKSSGITGSEASALLTQPEVTQAIDEIAQVEEVGRAESIVPEVSTLKDTPKPAPSYLTKRSRVTFDMENGTYSIPVIDVKECVYGVMVVLPSGANDVIFTPKPGAEVNVVYGQYRWACFSPGTVFNIPELGIVVISMIKRSGDDEIRAE